MRKQYENMQIIYVVIYNVEGAMFRAQGPYPNIENVVTLCDVM